MSLHADILNKRHTKGKLGELMPMGQLVDADYFLFLRRGSEWSPWSTTYLDDWTVPRFLVEASRLKYAQQLLRPLAVEDVGALRVRVAESGGLLRSFFGQDAPFYPLQHFNAGSIGSQ